MRKVAGIVNVFRIALLKYVLKKLSMKVRKQTVCTHLISILSLLVSFPVAEMHTHFFPTSVFSFLS